jgi:hypothetical protein
MGDVCESDREKTGFGRLGLGVEWNEGLNFLYCISGVN